MSIRHFIVTALIALNASAVSAGPSDHSTQPLHGGVVVVASDKEFELVAKADVVTLYVRDHGKNASTAGATAKLTVLTGTEKSELALAPAGDNLLQAKGAFKVGAGSKAVATVTLAGKKPVNVRFAIK